MSHKKWPKQCKKADVVPIYKKGDKSLTSNYRLVSLLSCLGKVLEKIIAAALRRHLEKNRLFGSKQFGFYEGKSVSDLILVLTNKWKEALNDGDDTAVVALNIAGVFDKVWQSGLLEKLESFVIAGAIL